MVCLWSKSIPLRLGVAQTERYCCCRHHCRCARKIPNVAFVLLPDVLQEPGSTVLVAGATGGVGQLLTAKLLEVSGRRVGSTPEG